MTLTDDQYYALLNRLTAEQAALLESVFADLLELIRQGVEPQIAVRRLLTQFEGRYYGLLSDAFGAVLARSVGVLELRDYPIGNVTLSERIHAERRFTERTVSRLIREHLSKLHSARELAKTLYEGHGFNEQEALNISTPLAKYLRDATKGRGFPDALEIVKAKSLAAELKTPALRAAYLQAIDAIAKDQGDAAIEKALRTAFYERNRYFANRIAQTELARAQLEQRALDLLRDDDIEWVQIRLSQSHPRPDICDLHAQRDGWGMGPGVYPKDQAPLPPFHPFCRCVASPRLDLTGNRIPQEQKLAPLAFLRTLTTQEAAQVMGSRARLQQILNGADLDAIVNKGRPKRYWLRRIGDLLDQDQLSLSA